MPGDDDSLSLQPEPAGRDRTAVEHRERKNSVLDDGGRFLILAIMEIKPTLLIVDDELGARQSLEVILEDDYRVLSAVNGLEALEILQTRGHRSRSPGREHA